MHLTQDANVVGGSEDSIYVQKAALLKPETIKEQINRNVQRIPTEKKSITASSYDSECDKHDPDYGDYVDPEAAKSLAQSNQMTAAINDIPTIEEENERNSEPLSEVADFPEEEKATPIEKFFGKIPVLHNTSPALVENNAAPHKPHVSALSAMIDKKSENQNPFAISFAGYVINV
jgi:hypothetical protein